MRRTIARAPFLSLAGPLILALSGCLSSGASNASIADAAAPTADYDAETCGLVGVVLDDAALPLSGAVVSLAGRDQSTETLAGGGYAFDNLPPGHYYVTAHKKGHDDAITPEAVACDAGGEIEAPALVLVANGAADEEGFKTPVHRRGVVPCGGHIGSSNLAQVCNGVSIVLPVNVRPPVNPAEPTSVPLEPGRITAAVVELEWEPSAGVVGPKSLRVQVPAISDRAAWTHETSADYETVQDDTKHTQTIFISGPSPLRLRLEAAPGGELWAPQPGAPVHWYLVRDHIPDSPLPTVALLVDQRFDLYVTYFYGDLPVPTDYTMLST